MSSIKMLLSLALVVIVVRDCTSQSDPPHATTRYFTTPGYNSTSDGYNSTSDGHNSTSDGYNSTSDWYVSTTPGYNSTSDGYNSTSDGYNSTSDWYDSTTPGYNSTSDGYDSTTYGYDTTTSGQDGHHCHCEDNSQSVEEYCRNRFGLVTSYMNWEFDCIAAFVNELRYASPARDCHTTYNPTDSWSTTDSWNSTGSYNHTGNGSGGSWNSTDAYNQTGSWNSTDAYNQTGSWNSTDAYNQTGSWNSTDAYNQTGSWNSTSAYNQTGSWNSTGAYNQTGSWNTTGAYNQTGSWNSTGAYNQTGSSWNSTGDHQNSTGGNSTEWYETSTVPMYVSTTPVANLNPATTYSIRRHEALIFDSPNCTEIQVSEGESGVISPMYEPGLASCYRILAAQGVPIRATFTEINVEYESRCYFDRVNVRGSGRARAYCGDVAEDIPTISGNGRLDVVFITDSGRASSFEIEYVAGCIPLTAESGSFRSPQNETVRSERYNNNENICWDIAAIEGAAVTLRIAPNYQLESRYDFVNIFSGSRTVKRNLSGSSRSAQNYVGNVGAGMRVRFTSDGSTAKKGFHATYTYNHNA